MKALFATVALLALLQTGCQETVTASPIDPPQLQAAKFDGAQIVEGRLKGWSRLDSGKRQQALLDDATRDTANIFADPKAWPDCDKLFKIADDMLASGTVYGIMQTPNYHQRAIGMGCMLEEGELLQRYEQAFATTFKAYKREVDPAQVKQAAAYLLFKSNQGMHTCAYQSMRMSRANARPFPTAIAAIRSDCNRPPHP